MTISELKSQLVLPAIVSPMFLVSGTQLVIATCKNGLLGTFPSLNGRTLEDFENMLIEITTALDEFANEHDIARPPFGVNIIVNKTNPRVQADLELCVKYKVPVIITSLGAIKEIVDTVHSYGGIVLHDVIKKRHAEKAAEAGVDGLIVVCAGAGGHAGTASPFALVEEIRSVYDGALLLAGSLSHGKDIAAAITLGADFAYMGTRFIPTVESNATQEYKDMITQASIKDIIYTNGVSGVNANFLIPSLERAGVVLDPNKEEDFSDLASEEAKAWKDIWSAGHGVTAIHKIQTTQELVEDLKAEYKEALSKQQMALKALKY